MNRLIDTHCHVYTEEFGSDLPDVIDRARQAGIERLLLPNINPDTLPEMLHVCDLWPDLCMPMIGLHPEDLAQDYHAQLDMLKSVLDADPGRFVGIGETGLDMYWDNTRLADQTDAFCVQIEWALEYDLPLVIHSRSSFNELYSIMDRYRNTTLRGIFHCFSGNVHEAEKLMEFSGFMFGIGGVLTYRKSGLADVLPSIPLNRIVLETDCPYLSPVPHRGQRNEPSFILHTAAFLARTLGVSEEEVCRVTSDNAVRCFRL